MRNFFNPSLLRSLLLHLSLFAFIWLSFYLGAPTPKVENHPPIDHVSVSNQIKNQIKKVFHSPDLSVGISTPTEAPKTGMDHDLLDHYLLEVIARINRTKRYPEEARAREQEGIVEVLLEVAPDGKIVHVEITKPTPFDSLNQAALSAIQQIGTIPPPTNETIKIRVPIQFQLQ